MPQLCKRRGILLTDTLLDGCPRVKLQIPVWLLTPDIRVSLLPILSLWSVSSSYQAIPEPHISPVPPAHPGLFRHSFPISFSSGGIDLLFQRSWPTSLHQLWYSPSDTITRPILCSSSLSNLVCNMSAVLLSYSFSFSTCCFAHAQLMDFQFHKQTYFSVSYLYALPAASSAALVLAFLDQQGFL